MVLMEDSTNGCLTPGQKPMAIHPTGKVDSTMFFRRMVLTPSDKLTLGSTTVTMGSPWQYTAMHLTGPVPFPRQYYPTPPLHQLEKATTICNGQTITLMGSAVCKYPTQGVDPCHKLCTAEFSMQWVLKISLQGSQGELQVAITRGRVMQ